MIGWNFRQIKFTTQFIIQVLTILTVNPLYIYFINYSFVFRQLPYKVSSSSNSSSQSSSWSSNSQLDWSDSSSNKTRSTYYTSESKNMSSLPSSYSNFRGSTSSLPLSFTDDRYVKYAINQQLCCATSGAGTTYPL